MDAKDFSKWFWDIAKYVVSAIIITAFLGKFEDPAMLYIAGTCVVVLFAGLGTFFYKRSKKK
ncbi:MAG: hypothetical protein LBP96_04235 [Bacteroidales bacterium]|jgi:hypothetical protein|nr:hypothetical protein [Bacteroidales bacterium]